MSYIITREPRITHLIFYYYITDCLAGKVIWITGCSSGIGEALAYQFASVGCKLVLSARREQLLNDVKQNCIGKQFHNICIDLPRVLGAMVITFLRNKLGFTTQRFWTIYGYLFPAAIERVDKTFIIYISTC